MAVCDELSPALALYSRATFDAPAETYTSAGYWDNRFQETGGLFDWYATYKELARIFSDYSPPSPEREVLVVGCGNSALSSEMHGAGFRRITNIDVSTAAIDKMREHFRQLNLEWRVMDATAMDFEDDSFDLAVDKGTLDALMHGPGCTGDQAASLSADVWRTLRPGGLFFLISHSAKRQGLLDGGLRTRYGADAHWEFTEVRRCRLSSQATFINIIRSKLCGRPISEAFKDPQLLREAAEEAKAAMRQMAFIEAFREFKAKKRLAAETSRALDGNSAGTASRPTLSEQVDRSPPKDDNDLNGPSLGSDGDPRKQPFCWCYILRKPAG